MKTFTSMLNDCLRLAFESKDVSYKSVKALCYPRMAEHPVSTSYRVSAIYEASKLLKQHRNALDHERRGKPYCRNPYFSASLGVGREGERLTMPDGISLSLNPHTLDVLNQGGVELVSATVTPGSLSIIYKKEIAQVTPVGAVALDINLRNVTSCDTEGRTERYDINELVSIQERFRRTTSRFRRQDRRLKRSVFRKHARIAGNRKDWVLNNITSLVVHRAAALNQTLVMENLRGIRSMFGKDTRLSAFYLSMLNAWPFAEFQRQVMYKARWEGLPVVYIDPSGTSNECSACGGGMRESPAEHPKLTCRACGLVIDRDLNAAKNILSRVLRSGNVGPASEAMVGRVSQGIETASKVDAGHSLDESRL